MILGPFRRMFNSALSITKATPNQLGAGAALGVFFALAPASSGVAWLAIILSFVSTANTSLTWILGLLLKPVSILLLDPLAWQVGRQVNEGPYSATISKLTTLPGVAILGLERYHVMGAFVLGLLAAIPVFLLTRVIATAALKGAVAARKAAQEKMGRGEKLTDEEKKLAEKLPKSGVPVRVLALLIVVLLFVLFDVLLWKRILGWSLGQKLPQAVSVALGTPPSKVEWGGLESSLFRGGTTVSFDDLRVADPRKPGEDLLRAKKAHASLSTLALIRGRVVIEELKLDGPVLHVRRDDDGRLTIDPAAGEKKDPNAAPAPAGESRWAKAVQSLLEEAKKRAEKEAKERAEKKDGEARPGEAKPGEPKPDATAQKPGAQPPTTPFERLKGGIPGLNPLLGGRPALVARNVILSGLEVASHDGKDGAPGFRFDEGVLKELSDDRVANGQPMQLHLKGAVIDAKKAAIGKVELSLTLDTPAVPDGPSKWKLSLKLADFDLAAAEAWVGSASPLRFEKGTAKIELEASGEGLTGALDASPVISLAGLVAKARDPQGKIAGLPAEKVATEVTEAGEFTLSDIKITGTILSPEIHAGDTIKNLVVEGGKRYAKKAATAVVDKATDKAVETATKKLGDKGGEAAKGLLDKGKSLFGGGDDKK